MTENAGAKNANVLSMELITALHHAQLLFTTVGQLMKQISSVKDGYLSILEFRDGTTEYGLDSNDLAQLQTRLDSVGYSLTELVAALQKLSPGFPKAQWLLTLLAEHSNLKPATGPGTVMPHMFLGSTDFSSKPTTPSTSSSPPGRSRRRKK